MILKALREGLGRLIVFISFLTRPKQLVRSEADQEEANQKEMAKRLNVTPKVVKEQVEALHEFNPMLGHRGCRLGVTYPEITAMQARAVFEAAAELKAEDLGRGGPSSGPA